MATAAVDERRANDSRVASKAKMKRLGMAERRARERWRGDQRERNEHNGTSHHSSCSRASRPQTPQTGPWVDSLFRHPGGWALGLRNAGAVIGRFISFPAFSLDPCYFHLRAMFAL
jgi:hypothetical protein